MNTDPDSRRTKIFISKATPGDDAFALWLAPRLEAEGYEVFADILRLKPGDGWRLKLTNTLQDESIKMLLCCSDETLQRPGVIEEVEIAMDLRASIPDPNFIIPLKLRRFKKVFGIGSLQYIDFERSWADGLTNLLAYLEDEDVPKKAPLIQPNWAAYQRRRGVELEDTPETLTSNWLRIQSVPDEINYVVPVGSVTDSIRNRMADDIHFPVVPHGEGYLAFASSLDFEEQFPELGSFSVAIATPYMDFIDEGQSKLGITSGEAKKILVNLFRQAWENHLRNQNFVAKTFSASTAFIVGEGKVKIKQRISWGRQGNRRNSMLRNIARKKVWEYGVSAQPNLFPFPHFRLKARVLFSEAKGIEKGAPIEDAKIQHRLRRSVCSTWRNKAWHGRMMAFMEVLAGDSPYVSLPVGIGQFIVLDAMPIQATSPVSARQRYKLGEDGEETDLSTLQGYLAEDEA